MQKKGDVDWADGSDLRADAKTSVFGEGLMLGRRASQATAASLSHLFLLRTLLLCLLNRNPSNSEWRTSTGSKGMAIVDFLIPEDEWNR